MASDDDNDEPDEATLAAFTKILGKVGPEWLAAHLKKTEPKDNPPQPSPSLESFLQESLRDTKKAMAELTRRMEAMRDVLTPEQLTQVKSALSDVDDQNSPKKKNPPEPPKDKPAPAAKPKVRWL